MTAMTPANRTYPIALLASLALAALVCNGCASDGGYDDDYSDRPGSGSGSGGGSSTEVPGRAEMVVQGRGTIRYRAPDDGRVWLTDADRRRVIDDRRLARGREYIVSPTDGKVWIDDDRVRTHEFDTRNDHRIYFLSDRAGPDAGGPVGPFPETGGGTVPKSATIAREGRGEDLSFAADGAGTVYLYDVNARRVLATHRLKKGQRFTVSPSKGEAAVDGNTVFRRDLSNRATYRLYFNLDV